MRRSYSRHWGKLSLGSVLNQLEKKSDNIQDDYSIIGSQRPKLCGCVWFDLYLPFCAADASGRYFSFGGGDYIAVHDREISLEFSYF